MEIGNTSNIPSPCFRISNIFLYVNKDNDIIHNILDHYDSRHWYTFCSHSLENYSYECTTKLLFITLRSITK